MSYFEVTIISGRKFYQAFLTHTYTHTHTHTHTHCALTLCNYTICSSHPALAAHAICGGATSKHSNYLNGFETKQLTITSNQITQFKSKTKKKTN